MNGPEALVVVVTILGLIIVVALVKSGRVTATILSKGLGRFELRTEAGTRIPPENSPTSHKKRIRVSQDTRSWMSRNWRAATILSCTLIIVVVPSWWWFSQPESWQTLISDRLSKVLELLLKGSRKPLEINTEEQTLEELTRVLKNRIAKLESDPYVREKIWIVDHYWRYWASDRLDSHLRVNIDFVRAGGEIHRMFILDESDLGDPKLKEMLRKQCTIAQDPATHGIYKDFELRLARRQDLKNSNSYGDVAKQFGDLRGSTTQFEEFDVVQFDDAIYFSNSFSDSNKNNGLKETLGRSTWVFDQKHVGSVHLKSLFEGIKPVGAKFGCSQFQ